MSNVFFEPWVGCQYSEGINGKRIMVLGHVHVCDGCDNCGVEKCDDFSAQGEFSVDCPRTTNQIS